MLVEENGLTSFSEGDSVSSASSVLVSEYANRRGRGKLITMVFSMQGVGLILGPLVAIVLLLTGINHDITWRVMLALGALPALATFYLRRQIAEAPRYALAIKGDLAGARRTVDMVMKRQNGRVAATTTARPVVTQPKRSWLYLLLAPRYLRWIIGTAGT